MIVDAHAHIFCGMRGSIGSGAILGMARGKIRTGDGRISNFLPPLAEEIRFSPEVLLEYMDQAGVAQAVLLQGPFYGDMNEYVLQAVQRWPKRLTGGAYLDLWSQSPREKFDQVVDQMGFRIVKLEISEATGLSGLHPGLRLDDPELNWFWKEVERREIVVVLDLGPVGGPSYQTDAVARLIETYAGSKIVIAHLAQPPMKERPDEQLDQLWQAQVCLARRPNVWLDLASLSNYAVNAGEDYPYPSAREYLRRAVMLVGVEKILWGSDAPATLLNHTYPQLLRFLTEHCDFLGRSEMANILGENAIRAFSLEGANDPKLV
jgi:predicted TIM-barrel fold metal-dependent hydrolase